ncbi:MAG: cohesin domain-containing protein [Candidatus Polarisedimenticolia bacterium]
MTLRRALIGLTLLMAAARPAHADRFAPPAVRPDLTVSARPSSTRPQVGSVIKVRVEVRGARQVGSVPFSLAYDPAILEFVPEASTQGSFLRKDGAATSFLAQAGTDREGRTTVVVGLSRLGTGTGASGSGVLCELTFRVRAPGAAPLTFVRARALSPSARPMEARFIGTSLHARRPR